MCRSGKSTPKKTTNYVAAEVDAAAREDISDSDNEAYDMFTLSSDGTSPYHVDVFLNGVPVQMDWCLPNSYH